MAKRFTDTEKWKKPWYRKLKPKYKVLWQYLTDNCDKSGIWEVDFELAGIFIGEELDVNEVRELFKKQFIELDNGKRWFIKDFIEFQYGTLNPNNPAHKNVYKELLERNIVDKSGQIKVLGRGFGVPSQGTKDKDKDKEEAKDVDKVIKGESEGGKSQPPSREEIREFFLQQNSNEDEADLFFAHYEGKDWKVFTRDGPERSIIQTRKWQLKAEEWIKRKRIKNIEREQNNGKFANSTKQGATDEELAEIATRRYLRQQREQ